MLENKEYLCCLRTRQEEGFKHLGFEKIPNEFVLYTEEECLEAMNAYGDNRWWLAEDRRILAYYQMHEEALLVWITTLQEGLAQLLCRTLDPSELSYGNVQLCEEVEYAWSKLSHMDCTKNC